MGYWGYNEGVNERPLERDSLRHDPHDPDRLPPFWQRFAGAAIFLGLVFLVIFAAKLFG